MTDSRSSDQLEAIQVVVDRVTSWQDGAPEGTVAQELRDGFAEAGVPDVMICDVILPDGSGLTLAAILKARHGCSTLVLSGYAPPADGLPDGVDGWPLKPVGLDALRDAVRAILERRDGGREAAGA